MSDEAVIAPEADIEAERIKPVTLAELATTAPTMVAVFVTSFRITTLEAAGPTRTTPLELPVPASRTKSPPVLPLCPAAWP